MSKHRCEKRKHGWGSWDLFPYCFPEKPSSLTLTPLWSGSGFLPTGSSAVIILRLCEFGSYALVALWCFGFWSSFPNCQSMSWSVGFFALVLMICRLFIYLSVAQANVFSQLRLPRQILDKLKCGSQLGFSCKMFEFSQKLSRWRRAEGWG